MAEPQVQPLIRDGILILPEGGLGGPDEMTPGPLVARFEAFAAAYLQGVRRVLIVDSAESAAARSGLRRFNALLAARGLPQMRLRMADAGSERADLVRSLFIEAAEVGGTAAADAPATGR